MSLTKATVHRGEGPRVTRAAQPGGPGLFLTLPAAIVAAVALIPVAYLIVRASEAGLDRVMEIVWSERTLRLTARSLWLAVSVTTLSVIVGVAFAALVTRTDLPGRRAWTVVGALPLAVPSYVAAYAWISSFNGLAGYTGAVLVLTACTYPYVFLPVVAVLRRTDGALEEISRSLGRSSVKTFLTVTLRQARPAIAGGGLLVALYTLSDFGAVALMRFDAFTRVIYTSYRANFDRTPAAVLGLVLIVLTVAITVAEGRSRGKAEQARIGSGVSRGHSIVRLTGLPKFLALAFTSLTAAVCLGYPLATLGYWLWRGQSSGIDTTQLSTAASVTVAISAAGALLAVTMALPVGILAARSRRARVRGIEQATYAGHALPGIVVALAMVFFGIRVVPALYQEWPLLVFTYAILFLPAAVGVVRASVALSSPRTEEIARSLGKGPWGVLSTVTIPLAAPGIAAGGALVMLTCMKELPATLLLRPTGMDTLATEMWTHTTVAQYAAAAPHAALLVALATIPALLLARQQIKGANDGSRP